MRRLILAALVALLPAAAADAPDSAVCVLFDLSQSAQSVRSAYLSDFTGVVDRLTGGELIVGSAITANSLATGRFEIQGEAPKFSPFFDNKLAYPKKLKAVQTSLKQSAEKLLSAPGSPTTDLLGGMQLAEKALSGSQAKGAKTRRLLVFSDMIEESANYNFRREALTPARIASILDRERKAGRIPALKGVEVWVAGAGGANREKYLQIQSFWFRYFEAAGASLQPSHYGATLMDFRL